MNPHGAHWYTIHEPACMEHIGTPSMNPHGAHWYTQGLIETPLRNPPRGVLIVNPRVYSDTPDSDRASMQVYGFVPIYTDFTIALR